MVRTLSRPRRLLAAAAVSAIVVPACGNDAPNDLSSTAAAGFEVYRSNGCAACHGSDGTGQVGPALVGLVGSEVILADGATVIADRDYLIESIVEPSAKIVEGYTLPMPATELTTAELDLLVAYIETLSDPDLASREGDS